MLIKDFNTAKKWLLRNSSRFFARLFIHATHAHLSRRHNGKQAFNSPHFHVAYNLVGEKHVKTKAKDFPGDTVHKNPPASAEDIGSIPGPGSFHMAWSN